MVSPEQIKTARRQSLLRLIPQDSLLRKRGRGWLTNCMFHDDKTPSFSIIKFEDGNWRFKCFGCGASGDPIHYIQKREGMSFIDAVQFLVGEAQTAPFKDDMDKKQGLGKLVKSYDYYDTSGVLLYQVQRYEPKTFRIRRPDQDQPGRWHWDMCGVQRVLFRLPALVSAQPGTVCFYVEGEKDCEALERIGLLATTHAGGALSYRRELLDPVKHLRLVVVPDNDDPGKQLMRRVWSDRRAAGLEKDTGFLILPEQYKDSSDYLAEHTKEEFLALVK